MTFVSSMGQSALCVNLVPGREREHPMGSNGSPAESARGVSSRLTLPGARSLVILEPPPEPRVRAATVEERLPQPVDCAPAWFQLAG
jgi:hypothetical protein